MNGSRNGMSCASGCWAMAGGIGLLAFVLLLFTGNTWPGSIFMAVVATLVLGAMFSYLFCRELPPPVTSQTSGRTTRTSAPKPEERSETAAAPAPHTEPEARPEPAQDTAPRAAVTPTKALAGEEELKSRKGAWRYEGDAGSSDGRARDPSNGGAQAPGGDTETAGSKPETLGEARAEGADDLKKIKGIGPKLERMCNSLGFYHFDQIAAWTPSEVAWVDQNLEGFKGRVTRDQWVTQAQALVAGGDRLLPEPSGDGEATYSKDG